MATQQIPNHAHCKICGRAIKYGEDVCSDECQGKLDEMQKKRRNMLWFIYGMMGLAVIMLFLQIGGGAG